MSGPKRYFINRLTDFAGGTVNVPKEIFKERCMEKVNQILSNQKITQSDCEGGLYVGIAGVSYMCYYLSQHPEFSEHQQILLEKSYQYLKAAEDYDNKMNVRKDKSRQIAFLLGSGGTRVVAASITKALGKNDKSKNYVKEYSALVKQCMEMDFLQCGSDELLVGRAGYMCGALYLAKLFDQEPVLEEKKVFALCDIVVKSGSDYSKRTRSACPLMYSYYNTEYLGAAHGLSGILQMLLSFPNYLLQHPEAEQKVKSSVDFLLSLQTSSGNFPSAMDEVNYPRSESDELVHWCHGAPGVVYLMAKAYLRWKENKYLQSCLSCGELTWKKGLLKKGPGICHGIAGSGYVFLLLYCLTNDEKHLHRAVQFANFLFTDEFKEARIPDQPLSLYEGLSGTVCFLADLLQPEKAHFPFFDIF